MFGKGNLFVVADGVGTKGNSHLASKMAIDRVEQCLAEQINLVSAIKRAHSELQQYNLKHSDCPRIGTTIVAALCSNTECNIAWVGDSRAYLVDLNSQTIEQLTMDHSLVGEMLANGYITAEEARVHPRRNVITRCLGLTQQDEIQVDTLTVQWHKNQFLLLCSDGVSGYMTDQMILHCLQQPKNLQKLTTDLLQTALSEGSRDNVSAVLIAAP